MNKNYTTVIICTFLVISCIINTKTVFADSALTENTWIDLTPMNTSRSYLGAVTLDGRIYAIGGSDEVATGGNINFPASNFTGDVIGINEVYDHAMNKWTSLAPMPTPRMGFAIAIYQGKIYCIGGDTHPIYTGWDWRGVTGINEVYDISTDTWQTVTSMPYPVTDFQANVVDGKIYCIGGIDTNGDGSKTNQVYDPATDTWTEKAPLPTSTFGYASAVLGEKIYIINGIDWYSMYGLLLNQIYNPQNDTWSLGASPPYCDTIGGVATFGIMNPERIYVIGKYTQIYNPMNNSWSLGKEISPSRGGFAVVNLDDKLCVMGGSIITSNMNSVTATETQFNLFQQYTPFGYGTLRPEISILSPENQTFNVTSFPLFFTVDRVVNWTGYSLDGQDNVTVTGNFSLANLSNGNHNITIYANDTLGSMSASETMFFTVDAPLPFTIMVGIIALTIIAVISLSCVVHYQRKKPKYSSQ